VKAFYLSVSHMKAVSFIEYSAKNQLKNSENIRFNQVKFLLYKL